MIKAKLSVCLNTLSNEAVVVLFDTASSCWACVSDYMEIFNSIGSHFKGKVEAITNGTPLRSLRIRAIQYTIPKGRFGLTGPYPGGHGGPSLPVRVPGLDVSGKMVN